MSGYVLIIDDEETSIDLFRVMFKMMQQPIVGAHTGADGLEAALKNPPILIFLDVMLPDMSGFEVCEKLKKAPQTAHIPVIFLSARTDEGAFQRARQAGADEFLVKPVTRAQLKAQLDKVISAQ